MYQQLTERLERLDEATTELFDAIAVATHEGRSDEASDFATVATTAYEWYEAIFAELMHDEPHDGVIVCL